jgi:hypothetical protein
MRDNAKTIVTQNGQEVTQTSKALIQSYTEYVQKNLSDMTQEHIMLAVVVCMGIAA